MVTSLKARLETIVLGCFGNALFAFVLSAGGLVMAGLAGQSAYASGIPAYKAIAIAAVILLIFALALYLFSAAVARYRKPILAAVITECPDKLIHEFAERDARNINEAVPVIEYEVDIKTASLPSPHVEFTFTVFNGSAYVVSIDRDIKGWIAFNGQRLKGDVTIVPAHALENLQHASVGTFRIRQLLFEREQADAILDPTNEAARFNFQNLSIGIKGNERVKPKPLRFVHTIDTRGRFQ